MTHSSTTTPGHSPIGDDAQDPQSQDIEVQEIEAQRLYPPKTASDEFAIGAGRMAEDQNDPTRGFQIPGAVRPGIVTLQKLFQMILVGRRVCGKYDAPCIYAAVPRLRGSSKKTNVSYIQMIPLDLDGTIKDQAGLDKLRRWCGLFGCILYSSARHNPAQGTYRLRVLLPVNASLSYEEARLVARSICGQLAGFLGTSDGIDQCCERPFQPMLLPGWATQELADQALCELFSGDIMDVTVPLADARRQLEEAEAVKRLQACAVVATRRPRLTSAATAQAIDGGDIDRLAHARLDLDAMGSIIKGGGTSNKDLFRAAAILRDWDVDQGDAIAEMQSRYPDQDPRWLEAKTRSTYEAGVGSPRTGWRLRAAIAESGITLEGLFDLESVVHATPPVSALPDHIGTLGANTLLNKGAPSGPSPSGPLGPQRWRREIYARYLPKLRSFSDLRARVTGIKSPTGTGKNINLQPAVQELLDQGGRIVTLAHRRSLTRSQSAVWGEPCYLDSIESEISGSTSICLDSVHRIAAGPVDVLILDEIEQLIRHLFSQTIRSRGQIGAVFSALRDLLRRAKRIIILDADLGPLSIFALRVLLGEEVDEEMIINTWKPSGTIRVRSEAGAWSDLVADVQAGRHVWIYCTSRKASERHAHLLEEMFPGISILLAHSGTTGVAEVQSAMSDPRQFALYQVVIATPSIGTGVSVDDPDLWHVYGDITSGCGPIATDAKQGVMRVRHPVRMTISIHGRVQHEPTNPEIIMADLLIRSEKTRNLLQGQTWTAKYSLDSEVAEIHPADLDITRIQAEVMGETARQGNHLHDIEIKDNGGNLIEIIRGSLLIHLESIGYTLDVIPDEATVDVKAIEEDQKGAKKAVDAAWVDAVLSAAPLSHEMAQALADAGASTPEAEAQLARRRIEEFYDLELDHELVTRDDRGRRRGHCRRFAQLLAWQRGEGQAMARLDLLDARAGVSAQLDHLTRRAALAAGCWSLFGIKDIAQDAKDGTVLRDPGDIGSIAQLRSEVKRYLGLTIKPGSSSMLLARALAAQAGFTLSSRRGRLADGTRTREYTLNRDKVSDVMQDSQAYYTRITDPGAARRPAEPTFAEIEEAKRAAEEMVAALLAA